MNKQFVLTFLFILSCGLVTITVGRDLGLINGNIESPFTTIKPLDMIRNELMGFKSLYSRFANGMNIPEEQLELYKLSFKMYCQSMNSLWNTMMLHSNEDELKPFKEQLTEAKSILQDTCGVVENGKIGCIMDHGQEIDLCYNQMPVIPTEADLTKEKLHEIAECNKKALKPCST